MKVVILAGGFGTRLSEYTDNIPKPMVKIGEKPIIWHIMNYYAKFGHKDFYLSLGYKSDIVKDYFLNYQLLNSDFTINMQDGSIKLHHNNIIDWKITLIDTGLNTMTGGRIKMLENYIKDETFMLTYGDGLSNVNINELINCHKQSKKIATVTAVRPSARFGELEISDDKVLSFQEKPQIGEGWINGGFFIMEPEFLKYIDGPQSILEKEPLEKIVEINQLGAYKHTGFWQCMDTKRDKDYLESLFLNNNAPWI